MAEPIDLQSGPELEYLKKLASGPLGPVWLARVVTGEESGRLVTARCLSLAQFDQEELERVVSVARQFARVTHPCLAKGLGAHCARGQLIVLGEYVTGVPLTALRRIVLAQAASIPPPVAVRIVRDVLRGASAVRDECAQNGPSVPDRVVFPDTVIVASFGETLLSDVGVAAELYHCQDIRGLPEVAEVLSPEELLSPEPPGQRAEVFSLGVLLWELLQGRRLFGGADCRKTVEAVLYAPIPPVQVASETDLSIVEPLAALVHRATLRDRALRFSSLLQMADTIAALPPAAVASDADVQTVISSIAGDYLSDSEWCGGLASVKLANDAEDSSRVTDLSSEQHAPLPECYLPWEPPTLAGRRDPSSPSEVSSDPLRALDTETVTGSEPATAILSDVSDKPPPRRGGTIALLVGALLVLFGVVGLSLLRGPLARSTSTARGSSLTAKSRTRSQPAAHPRPSTTGAKADHSALASDRAEEVTGATAELGAAGGCGNAERVDDAGCPPRVQAKLTRRPQRSSWQRGRSWRRTPSAKLAPTPTAEEAEAKPEAEARPEAEAKPEAPPTSTPPSTPTAPPPMTSPPTTPPPPITPPEPTPPPKPKAPSSTEPEGSGERWGI